MLLGDALSEPNPAVLQSHLKRPSSRRGTTQQGEAIIKVEAFEMAPAYYVQVMPDSFRRA